jgi:hypothetical protein
MGKTSSNLLLDTDAQLLTAASRRLQRAVISNVRRLAPPLNRCTFTSQKIMPHFTVAGRLGPALIGGILVALLGWVSFGSLLPGAAAPVGAWVLGAAVAFGAPSTAKAWRRVLLLAALLSFVAAWATWVAVLGGTPGAVQATRAENAPGFSLLVLVGAVLLLIIGPAFFILLGLVLAVIAYFVGREPTRRKGKKPSRADETGA